MDSLLLFVIILLISSVLQGVIGFGYALIAMPLLLRFVQAETVVSSILVISLGLNTFLYFKIKSKVNTKFVGKYLLISLISMPVGLWLLNRYGASLVNLIVGGVVIFMAIAIGVMKLKIKKSNTSLVTAAIIGGMLSSTTSLNAPPIVLLLRGWRMSRAQFRRTLAMYFSLSSAFTLILFTVGGALTSESLRYGLYSLPGVVVGAVIGESLGRRINNQVFSKLVTSLIVIMGIGAIVSAF